MLTPTTYSHQNLKLITLNPEKIIYTPKWLGYIPRGVGFHPRVAYTLPGLWFSKTQSSKGSLVYGTVDFIYNPDNPLPENIDFNALAVTCGQPGTNNINLNPTPENLGVTVQFQTYALAGNGRVWSANSPTPYGETPENQMRFLLNIVDNPETIPTNHPNWTPWSKFIKNVA